MSEANSTVRRERFWPALGAALASCLFVAGPRASGATIAVDSVSASPASVPKYGRVELAIALSHVAATKFYDPAPAFGGLDLAATFTSPTSTVRSIKGFYDGSSWCARFAPNEVGTWAYAVTATDSSGTSNTASGTFECVASESAGWVRIDGPCLRFAEGQVLFGVGHNTGWQLDVEQPALASMAAKGENLLSFWLATPWAEAAWGAEWAARTPIKNVADGIGNYSQAACAYLDAVVERAEAAGVCLLPTIWSHGQLRAAGHPWGEGWWYNNAYSTVCTAADFFELTSGASCRGWGMKLADRGYAWVQNTVSGSLGGQTVSIPGLATGHYAVAWYDAWTSGATPILITTIGVYDDGVLRATIPALARADIALRFTTTGNTVPTAADDAWATSEDTPLSVPAPGVLANDTDPESDPLSAAIVAGPAHGTLTLEPDGSFAYTPAAGYAGTDSFTYEAYVGTTLSNKTTVTITVAARPTAALALKVSKSTSRTSWAAKAKVTVKDAAGKAIAGATVAGHWSGAGGGAASAATNKKGVVAFTSDPIALIGTAAFTVDSATKNGLAYTLAGQTSGSIAGAPKKPPQGAP